MIVTIHQPNNFPYSGFFHKLSLADTLVLLDNTQFQFDYTNRNKILKPDGKWTRIIVPIKKHQKFLPINQVEIDNDKNWKDKNLNLLLALSTFSLSSDSMLHGNSTNQSKYVLDTVYSGE